MKMMRKILENSRVLKYAALTLGVTFIGLVSCEENELPGVGDLIDLNPPVAEFGEVMSSCDYLIYSLVNKSTSSTDFKWEIPDGVTLLTEDTDDLAALENEDILVQFPATGSYEFTLTSSDKNLVTDSITKTIVIEDVEAESAVPSYTSEQIADEEGGDSILFTLTNTSINSCNSFEWMLPEGMSLNNPAEGDAIYSLTDDEIVVVLDAFGSYDVSVTGKNIKGEPVTVVQTLEAETGKTEPILVNPSLERDNDENTGAYGWTNTAVGQVPFNTTSSVNDGANALKFSKNEAMTLYQEVDVFENTEYKLDFFYAMKKFGDSGQTGAIQVRVLNDGGYDSPEALVVPENNITLSQDIWIVESGGSKDYNFASVTFNSGSNTKISLVFRGINNSDPQVQVPYTTSGSDKPENTTYPVSFSNAASDGLIDNISLKLNE